MIYYIITAIILVIADIIVLIWWNYNMRGSANTLDVLNFLKLKKNTKLNLFGVIFVGILLNIMMLPLAIVYWLKLACTWHPNDKKRYFQD